MSIRLKRLYNEYQEISKTFANHPNIIIKDVFGNPPEKYHIEYRVKGLVQHDNNIVKRDSHLVEIILPAEYPGMEPMCRMPVPAFHPNIDANKICIADYWAAGESVVDVILRIGEIISYENYNIKSPRNGEAARWAEQNMNRFPIDTADLTVQKPAEEDITAIETAEIKIRKTQKVKELEEVVCSNCGTTGDVTLYYKCSHGHLICPECSVECQKCGKVLCILCPLSKCSTCGKVFCSKCQITCPLCGNVTCKEHLGECCVCQCGAKGKDVQFRKCSNGHLACPDCIVECQKCGKVLCVLCTLNKCSTCGEILCDDCQTICSSCGKVSCKEHLAKCSVCKTVVCSLCVSICPTCKKTYCHNHINEQKNCCTKSDKPVVEKPKIILAEPSADRGNKKLKEKKNLICNKCGHTIEDLTANFCEMCGNKL